MGFEGMPEYEEIAQDMATLYGKRSIAHKIRQTWTSYYYF
jgi:hypothetical protein